MVKPSVLFLALATASAPVLATLTATVDKLVLNEGEAIRYTLESDSFSVMGSPDFSPLEKNFIILSRGQNQSRVINFSGGKNTSTTTWKLILQPKKPGTLSIPSVSFNNDQSQPIRVEVKKGNSDGQGTATTSNVYIRSSISTEELWQNQEAILTLKIYSRADYAESPNLTPPEADNVSFKVFGKDEDEEQIINGVRHRVITRRYIISPTQAGTVTIPGQVLTGYIEGEDPYGRSRLMRMVRPEPFRAVAPDITLKINPIPANWPSNKPWLPAESMNISESWSSDTSKIAAGDSVTRTVKIRAQGSNSAQIPPLPPLQLPNVKTYPDQPVTEDNVGSRGPIGTRSESVALVPTQAGHLEIPAVNITWFNTKTQQIETARLEGQTITVLLGTAPLSGTQPVINQPGIAQPAAPAIKQIQSPTTETKDGDSLIYWQIATGTFGLLWLGTLTALVRRKKPPATAKSSTKRKTKSGSDEQKAFQHLLTACASNSISSVDSALKQWGQLLLKRPVYSSGEVIESLNSTKLSNLWMNIQQSRYSQSKVQSTNTDKLAQAFKAARKNYLKRSQKAVVELDAINP
ncbi:BatD family protein [Parendozoicomonas sp. Alg238-R29]|uniref:BatD family protein n=1 Tax=Parendozoicomonas sp. Alg238-R29 TaxID=2993446 RepID=UPI00248EACE5|nr:BatD family protein [Parendozoicomonas sp. Alg238-R29]